MQQHGRSLRDRFESSMGAKDRGGRKGFAWEFVRIGDRFADYKHMAFALVKIAKSKGRGTSTALQMQTVFNHHKDRADRLGLTMYTAAKCWKAVFAGKPTVQVKQSMMSSQSFLSEFGLTQL